MAAPNTLFNQAAQDSVAVFNASFGQVFQNARPMIARATPSARLADHPLEDGQTVSDYKVTIPTSLNLLLFASADDYRDVYAEITELFEKSELLTVQTKASTFPDMVIMAMPHEEKSDMYDAIVLNVTLRRVKLVAPETEYAPENATDADAKALGERAPTAPQAVETAPSVKIKPTTGTGNNYFQPDSSEAYTISGVETGSGQAVIGGTTGKILQTGLR